MRELPGEQNTDKWFQHRIGRITASRINDLMDRLKGGGEGAKRRHYRFELLAERLTQRVQPHYVSAAMQWGTDHQQEAMEAFERETGQMLLPCGFALHPLFDYAGASPDALVADAILEVKCPESTTYLEWMFQRKVPDEHVDQMLWQMVCTERQRGIFLAYDPRQRKEMQFFVRQLNRDEARIEKIEYEADLMNAEIEAMVKELGLPPTEWNTAGDEVIHTSRELGDGYDHSKSLEANCDFLDKSEMTP